MSKSSGFLLGADPELFLQRTSDKKILSAIGRLGGTKKEPVPVEELGKGFAYQEDNVLVEYNIPPAGSADSFLRNNKLMLAFLRNKVKAEHGCELVTKASHVMDDDELADPRAHIFGCDPDFNVWTLEDNPKPHATNPNLRSAGGHIHIGLKMGRMDKIALGRLLDSTVGLWSVTADPDTQRRELYGKAGAIRDKSYGLEYRTLSNFWLKDDRYMVTVWQYVERAIQLWQARDFSFIEKHGEKIFQTINNSDKATAEEMLGLR